MTTIVLIHLYSIQLEIAWTCGGVFGGWIFLHQETSEFRFAKKPSRRALNKFTLPPIIMVQWKMANCLKGNYYWRDPFSTSMIMGERV